MLATGYGSFCFSGPASIMELCPILCHAPCNLIPVQRLSIVSMTFDPYARGRSGGGRELRRDMEGQRRVKPLTPHRSEVEFTAIRAQGPGGQHVNKVSSAIQLRFDVAASSLPDGLKTRWLQAPDNRLTAEGVLVIKAQRFRTQDANRQDAWDRLLELMAGYARAPKTRKATRPTRASVQRRLQSKTLHARLKASRQGLD